MWFEYCILFLILFRLYEENLECGFRFYEQIGLGWCDKMQFEKDFIWYINGLDAIMTKATGTPLGQPDVVERCIGKVYLQYKLDKRNKIV